MDLLEHDGSCLLYTSDAADERSSVDLGGRRIIKKKKNLTSSGVHWYEKETTHKHINSKCTTALIINYTASELSTT